GRSVAAAAAVMVVVGAPQPQNPRGAKQNPLERLIATASSCEAAEVALHAGPSVACTRRLVLTLEAVMALVGLSSSSEDGGCVTDALEVLSWLRPRSPPAPLFHQVLVMAPGTRGTSPWPALTRARRDGVDEACALARVLADAVPNPAQAGRVAVFFWDDDADGDAAGQCTETTARHALLLRHGVKTLSRRRAQVQRAKADVMQILRAPATVV
ncbi:uncharacterized protein Tco025E_09401, partial [Trypanosoma conorhini]